MFIKIIEMERLLGNWNLLKNDGFGEFLKFTQIPWYKRKLAEYSGIDISIKQNGDEFLKKINSTFYKNEEKIIFNDNYITSGTTHKKYSYVDDSVLVEIKGSIVNWHEKIYIDNRNLVVEYIWKDGDKEKFAKQIFKSEK
tara:strand:- start:220 stop:639 length:420 start_codon:yes stop_codon:yes gene_type:complete